jgi:hypothetical protein
MKTADKVLGLSALVALIVIVVIMGLGMAGLLDGHPKAVKTTPSFDRTVIGTVQTIDSYSDYSVLHFDNSISINITNSSLNNWFVANMFGQLATYQLQGMGLLFDNGYHEYNLVNFQIEQVIIGGK